MTVTGTDRCHTFLPDYIVYPLLKLGPAGYVLACIVSFSMIVSCSAGNTADMNEAATKKSSEKKAQEIPVLAVASQEWMAEDLQTKKYKNGDPIIEAQSEKEWKKANNKKQGCYYISKRGTFLYNGYALEDNRGLAPEHFRIPGEQDFEELMQVIGTGTGADGEAAISMATYSWDIEEWDEKHKNQTTRIAQGTNTSGFNAKPTGFIFPDGSEGSGTQCSFWWTITNDADAKKNLLAVDIGYCSQDVGGGVGAYEKGYGFAVRCIKNNH